MVMVGVVKSLFISGVSIAKLNWVSESALDEELERSIDGCEANGWISLFDASIKLFATDVSLHPQENIKDEIPLGGAFQFLLTQTLVESAALRTIVS